MRLNVLPVIERELLAAARDPRLCKQRLAAGAMILLYCVSVSFLWNLLGTRVVSPAALFQGVAAGGMVVCLFQGLKATSDCLSWEKREGTLGLLFLTHLTAGDIVIGKLVAGSLTSFMALLTGLPLLGFCWLLGGVELGQFLKVLVNLVAALFLGLAVGMFTSARFKEQRRSAGYATLIVSLLAFGSRALGEYLRHNAAPTELSFALVFISPVFSHEMAFRLAAPLLDPIYWASILKTLAMGVAFLFAASRQLEKQWQDQPVMEVKSTRLARIRRSFRLEGRPPERPAVRKARMNLNPIYWLAMRNPQVSGLWVIAILGLVVVVVSWLKAWAGGPVDHAMVPTIILASVLTFSGAVTFANAVSMWLAQDRLSGALELILCTPLGVRSIIAGHWRAMARQFGPYFLTVIAVDFAVVWAGFQLSSQDFGWEVVQTFLVHVGMAVAQLTAVCWVGMWQGLVVRQPNHAPGTTVFRVFLLPVVLWACTMMLVNWAWEPMNARTHLVVYASMVLLNSLFFAVTARNRVWRDFRKAVADTYAPQVRVGWWGSAMEFVRRFRTKRAVAPIQPTISQA